MSDELIYDLRYPPTMSMAVNHEGLYRVMAKRMREAADEIERLHARVARLESWITDEAGCELPDTKEQP